METRMLATNKLLRVGTLYFKDEDGFTRSKAANIQTDLTDLPALREALTVKYPGWVVFEWNVHDRKGQLQKTFEVRAEEQADELE